MDRSGRGRRTGRDRGVWNIVGRSFRFLWLVVAAILLIDCAAR